MKTYLERAREIVGDERARKIEQMGREDAEKGQRRCAELQCEEGASYWVRVRTCLELMIYFAAFYTRKARLARKAGKGDV